MKTLIVAASFLGLIACWPPPGNVAPDAGSCARAPIYDGEPCCPSDIGLARCFGSQAWVCEVYPPSQGPQWFLNGASPVSASCAPKP